MTEQTTYGDFIVVELTWWKLPARQVLCNRPVQVQFALLDEFHGLPSSVIDAIRHIPHNVPMMDVMRTGVSMAGYALKWFCYSPQYPLLLLLPAPLLAFGLGGLFTLMGSMIADVCDLDELQTHERREGMFGSIYWWVVKLGMAAALAISGLLLNATGFDVALGGNQAADTILLMRLFDVVIPFVGSAIAIWMIASYPITEKKAHEVRLELERHRGELA